MINRYLHLLVILAVTVIVLSQCGDKSQNEQIVQENKSDNKDYCGFSTPEEYGEHLVTIIGCNDCHTPKKMGPHGPVPDSSLWLSGHPANMPAPDVNRAELEKKGIAASNTLTAWVGPWGISYAPNLTSHETGIGSWQEENFIYAIRNGKSKGIKTGRPILPPMPWEMFRHMSDEELKAIFAYLKTTKPIDNKAPSAEPPTTATKK